MTLSDDDIDLIRENVDGKIKYWSNEEVRKFQESCYISEKEFVVYILSESGKTQKEIADLMDYSDPGTVAGYTSRVRNKLEKSEKTLEIEEVI